jgi:hypothetical protein
VQWGIKFMIFSKNILTQGKKVVLIIQTSDFLSLILYGGIFYEPQRTKRKRTALSL